MRNHHDLYIFTELVSKLEMNQKHLEVLVKMCIPGHHSQRI